MIDSNQDSTPNYTSPAVSVVIPTYNRSDYLRQAIQSVLAQTFQDFEVIVIDDGSTDSTANVVDEFGDKRIRYLYQENAGRSAARNRGLSQATGDYIAFLDDDDLYLPHKLECQVRFLENHPKTDVVVSDSHIIDEAGLIIGTWRRWQDVAELTLEHCVVACPISTCAVLMRNCSIGISQFEPGLEHAEDTDFYLQMLCAGRLFSWLKDIVSMRRIHHGRADRIGYAQGYLRMLDNLFARRDIPDTLLKRQVELYAHYTVVGALLSYADGDVMTGQRHLQRALSLAPTWAEGKTPELAERIAGFAESRWVSDPLAFIDRVCSQLPDSISAPEKCRRQSRGSLYLQRVFKARRQSRAPRIEDWCLSLFYRPDRIIDRGTWSILLYDILLPKGTSCEQGSCSV